LKGGPRGIPTNAERAEGEKLSDQSLGGARVRLASKPYSFVRSKRPFPRPDHLKAKPGSAGAVNEGRRLPPEAARSVIDGPKHAGTLHRGGRLNTSTERLH